MARTGLKEKERMVFPGILLSVMLCLAVTERSWAAAPPLPPDWSVDFIDATNSGKDTMALQLNNLSVEQYMEYVKGYVPPGTVGLFTPSDLDTTFDHTELYCYVTAIACVSGPIPPYDTTFASNFGSSFSSMVAHFFENGHCPYAMTCYGFDGDTVCYQDKWSECKVTQDTGAIVSAISNVMAYYKNGIPNAACLVSSDGWDNVLNLAFGTDYEAVLNLECYQSMPYSYCMYGETCYPEPCDTCI